MYGKRFFEISQVTAPLLHVGQEAEAFCTGGWKPCRVKSVCLEGRKEGRKQFWVWSYIVHVEGEQVKEVSIQRYDYDPAYSSEITLAVRVKEKSDG